MFDFIFGAGNVGIYVAICISVDIGVNVAHEGFGLVALSCKVLSRANGCNKDGISIFVIVGITLTR